MAPLIHDRGRGPEIRGTRITVYDLAAYFLDPAMTERRIARLVNVAEEEVAAARAYYLQHVDEVDAQNKRIDERNARGNPPELLAQSDEVRQKMWQLQRQLQDGNGSASANGSAPPPQSFREWLAEEEAVLDGAG